MLRAKKLNSPQGTSQSPDLILKEQDFKLLKTKVKPKRLTNYWTWLQYLGENLNGLNTMMVISKVILPWVFVSSLFLNLLEKTRSFIERDYTGVWYIRIICHNLHQIFGNASRIVFKLIWEHGKRPLEASGQKMQIQLTQQETNILKIHHFLLLILTRVARLPSQLTIRWEAGYPLDRSHIETDNHPHSHSHLWAFILVNLSHQHNSEYKSDMLVCI